MFKLMGLLVVFAGVLASLSSVFLAVPMLVAGVLGVLYVRLAK